MSAPSNGIVIDNTVRQLELARTYQPNSLGLKECVDTWNGRKVMRLTVLDVKMIDGHPVMQVDQDVKVTHRNGCKKIAKFFAGLILSGLIGVCLTYIVD